MDCTCEVCGRDFKYDEPEGQGYDRRVCGPYCDGKRAAGNRFRTRIAELEQQLEMSRDPMVIDEARWLDERNAGADSLARSILGDTGAGSMSPGPCADLQELVRGLRQQLAKMTAFKAWVHNWLDQNGVPENPDPENCEKTGCRIGGRMEWLKHKLIDANDTIVLRDVLIDDLRQQLAAKTRECERWERLTRHVPEFRVGDEELWMITAYNTRIAKVFVVAPAIHGESAERFDSPVDALAAIEQYESQQAAEVKP